MVRSYGVIHDSELLRCWKFEGNRHIPVRFLFSTASILQYDWKQLESLALQHPKLFPHLAEGALDPSGIMLKPWQCAGKDYKDSWGAVWKTSITGMTGCVVSSPLKDLTDKQQLLKEYKFPDPEQENGWEPVDWEKDVFQTQKSDLENYGFCTGELRHGFLFLTLEYLRGYENLVVDMFEGADYLPELIRKIEFFNEQILRKFLRANLAVMFFPEDLGAQVGPLITPEHFRSYLKPSYTRLMGLAKQNGALCHMHSDGDIRNLAEDLIDCGIDIINLQDRVNGLDDIVSLFSGRVAVDLDLDRQEITRVGSRKDILEYVQEIAGKLSSRNGGLSLVYDLYPGIPVENIAAVMDAFESINSDI